jgi:RNA polymerase sigma factor (sigma-70 family)
MLDTHVFMDASTMPSEIPRKRTGDSPLPKGLTGGTSQTLERLIECHGAMVRATCRRRLGDASLWVDDACQAVFLALAHRGGSIRDVHALPAWLHRTALRICGHIQRSEERRRRRESCAAASKAEPASSLEWIEHLDAALVRLPVAQRVAVVLHVLEGRPHADAARDMGCSESAAKMRVHDGIKAMRALLQRRGVTVSTAAVMAAFSSNEEACVPRHEGPWTERAQRLAESAVGRVIPGLATISVAAATAIVLLVLSSFPSPVSAPAMVAQDQAAPPTTDPPPRVDSQTVIEPALAFLSRCQCADGSWPGCVVAAETSVC